MLKRNAVKEREIKTANKEISNDTETDKRENTAELTRAAAWKYIIFLVIQLPV